METKIIFLYTKKNCPYSLEAKKLLKILNINFKDYELDPNNPRYHKLKEKIFDNCNHYSFPIIFVEDYKIGGYTELRRLYDNDKLLPLITKK